MEKVDLTRQFALRLKDAMLTAGFRSGRSTSGVDVHKLAEITGYSTQICRKYLRGEAIPEPAKLVDIARNLGVAPGWLLFGDEHNDSPYSQNSVAMSRELLRYIFKRARLLYNSPKNEEDIADFLLELINDISQINATEEQSRKIIDLSFASVQHFA